MKWLASLRARLLATYLGLILLGFGGLTLFSSWQIANSAYTDFATTLQVNAALLAASLAEPLHEMGEYRALPQQGAQLVTRTAENLDARVLILDRQERVLWDSEGSGLRPQRVNGFPHRGADPITVGHTRVPDESGEEQVVVTAPLQGEHGVVGYVQIAAPAAQPRATVRDRWLVLGIGFLIFTLVGIGISLWLLSTLIRPLTALRDTALRMAGGDLAQRIARPGADEIGAVGQAFNQMAEQVETMVEEQRAFASNASHELRTPLTTMRLRTEALRSDVLDPATQQQYLVEIDQEVAHMSGLVDDLILLSRLDAHRLAVGTEQVDISRVIRSVRQELDPIITAKALTIDVEIPSAGLPTVQANLNHLRVVLRNLCENGVKYTPAGGRIVITVAQDNEMIRCAVQDNGHGIAPDDLPQVHKRFHRAAQDRQRQPGVAGDGPHDEIHDGSGLGLALVHSIVTLYGGRLVVTSTGLGQGTSATIWWPITQATRLSQEAPLPH